MRYAFTVLGLVLGLFGWGFAAASPYRMLNMVEALGAPAGTLVRVWGRYQPDLEGQTRIAGQLVSGDKSLSIEGRAFDWRPEPGALIEVWGKLGPGPVLQFYNGRSGSETRRPRLTPPLRDGETVSVWLEVREVGLARFSLAQGITEDRRVFLLPQYEGRRGIVCLRGEVGFLTGPAGRKTLLREARRCAVR